MGTGRAAQLGREPAIKLLHASAEPTAIGFGPELWAVHNDAFRALTGFASASAEPGTHRLRDLWCARRSPFPSRMDACGRSAFRRFGTGWCRTATKLILEPIVEADFLDCSYGYRPARSAMDALRVIEANLRDGYTAVYDANMPALRHSPRRL